MNKNIIFIYFWIFYVLWIFINNMFQILTTSLLVLLFLVVLFLLLLFKKYKYSLIIIFSIIWLIIGISISYLNIEKIQRNSDFLNNFRWKNLFIIEIVNTSKINEDWVIYVWKLKKINNTFIKWNILTEVNINWNYKLKKWTIIKLESKIYNYKNFNWFNYIKYNLSKDIYFKLYPYKVDIIEKKQYFIYDKILNLRENIINTINKIYTKDEAIFLAGILLWARENMSDELSENFNKSWLTHIIAVSWFNITIIIIFFWFIINWFSKLLKVTIMAIFISIFVILVWWWASVIRAAIMWLIWYIVISEWRSPNILSIIIFTLIIMLYLSPLSLNYDISLQLSFLAVLWIIYINWYLEKVFYFITNIFEIRNAFTLTISALIFTLPIIIFNFWQLSIISPLSNILVIWTIPLIMLSWFLSIILYHVNVYLWIFMWYFSWIFLSWDILIVNTLWWFKYSVLKYDFWIYKYYYEIIFIIILFFLIIWYKKWEKN